MTKKLKRSALITSPSGSSRKEMIDLTYVVVFLNMYYTLNVRVVSCIILSLMVTSRNIKVLCSLSQDAEDE